MFELLLFYFLYQLNSSHVHPQLQQIQENMGFIQTLSSSFCLLPKLIGPTSGYYMHYVQNGTLPTSSFDNWSLGYSSSWSLFFQVRRLYLSFSGCIPIRIRILNHFFFFFGMQLLHPNTNQEVGCTNFMASFKLILFQYYIRILSYF